MANHVTSDRGETVIAVGAPGSIERVKVEWPALIEKVAQLYEASADLPGRGLNQATEMIQSAGVDVGSLTMLSILEVAGYRQQKADEIVRLIRRAK